MTTRSRSDSSKNQLDEGTKGGLQMKRDARNHTTKAWKLGLLTLLLTALAPSMSFAQAVSARLVGSVQDSSKSRVVAATVIAHAVATGIDTKAVTDSSGEYNFANILPGQYLLTASAEGFQTIEVRDVVLQIGDAKKLDITLSPKSVTQTVEVVETVPTIDTESTKVGAVVDSHQAQDLPLADRDAMKLFFLQAGTNPLDDLFGGFAHQQLLPAQQGDDGVRRLLNILYEVAVDR